MGHTVIETPRGTKSVAQLKRFDNLLKNQDQVARGRETMYLGLLISELANEVRALKSKQKRLRPKG